MVLKVVKSLASLQLIQIKFEMNFYETTYNLTKSIKDKNYNAKSCGI